MERSASKNPARISYSSLITLITVITRLITSVLSATYTVITEPKSGNHSVSTDYRPRTGWAKALSMTLTAEPCSISKITPIIFQ